jgi:dihydroflavonol-4-reductase
MVSSGTLPSDDNFLRHLRRAGVTAPVVAFGPSAHFALDAWLADGLVQAVLEGEPEAALGDALARAGAGGAQGRVQANSLCPDRYRGRHIGDLDGIPMPAWDLVAWARYGALSALTSRGCPAGCAYCAYTVPQGPAFRSQSVDRTVAELAWLVDSFAPGKIYLRDPVFAHDGARAAAICEGLVARKVRPRFNCESRPEHLEDDLLRLMQAAGCYMVKIGLESADPAVLGATGRLSEAEAGDYLGRALGVARTCLALGMRCQVYVMVGLPGETPASLRVTESALRRFPAGVVVRARAYEQHPGAELQAPSALVEDGTLTRLEEAPAGHGWRSALGRVGRALPTVARRSGPAPSLGTAAVPDRTGALPAAAGAAAPALLRGARVFVTGGNGFVGGHVVQLLVAEGAAVTVLLRSGSAPGPLTGLPVDLVKGDLVAPDEWRRALEGCDLCFHIAALYARAERAADLYRTNVSGTAALLEACAGAGVRRVVVTGTVGILGRSKSTGARGPDESAAFDLWRRASPYVRSKHLAVLAAESWEDAGVEVITVLPTAPVGPGDARPSPTGQAILATLRGEAANYPRGGVNHAPVADVAAGHLLAATRGRPGRRYILGHLGGNLTYSAFVDLVAAASGGLRRRPSAPKPAGPGLPPALTADPSRAITELGLPQSDLAAAFAEAVAWFRAAGMAPGMEKAA